MHFSYNPERIKTLCEEEGISRYRLARLARLTDSTVRNLFRGAHAKADELTLEAVARALHVHPNEISADYVPPVPPWRVGYDQDKIKGLRAGRGLTLQEAASRAKLPLSTVHSLETRERPSARPETLHRLARAYGVLPGEISEALYEVPDPLERYYYPPDPARAGRVVPRLPFQTPEVCDD